MTDQQKALYGTKVLQACLLEAGDDVDAGLAAAEYILSTQPFPDNFVMSTDVEGNEHRGKGEGGGQFVSKVRTVGEDWHGKLIHGTTEKSAKHFIAGTNLPVSDRSHTYSEWGDDVIYASDHDTPHQALMFASHKSKGAGGKRLMVEFQLKPGSKIIDLSDEMTRRPAWGMGGPEQVEFRDGKRPSFTDDMIQWLEEKRAGVARKIDVRAYVDPESENFSLSEYLPLLKSYAKDRGFAAVRLHDETVIVDKSAIQSARKMKPNEVEELRQKPRLRRPFKGGNLYSDFETNDANSRMMSIGDDLLVSVDAFFAYDISNRHAQGILNRSLQAAKGLTASARKDLATALKRDANGSGEAILNFINKYRLQLAKLLTTTQLASLLEGAREVAAKVPTLATFPGALAPPPSLEPREAITLVERLEKLTDVKRAEVIYDLPADQQTYVQQALAAKEAAPPIVPPTFTPPAPPAGSPEGIHFPTIEEAVKQLAEKNVMTRERFDALDAAAKAKSFAVAGVDAEETLTKIRDVLAENVRKGADYETFKQEVLDAVDEGTFLSDAHQETVFRTNVQEAFSSGQESVLSHPLVRSGFPYRQRDAIHDDRAREEHLALEKMGIDGTNIFRGADPVWQLFRSPWGYNCRCSDTPLTVRQAAESGIAEAEKWLETGVEPSPPAFVPMPDFTPPPGFQRAIASAPLSIRLSMQSLAMFAFNPSEPRDELGEWTAGSAKEVQSKEPGRKETRIERRAKGKTKAGRVKQRSLFRRLRIKKRWSPSVSLAVDATFDTGEGQWITIGGTPDPKTGEKHVGGFKVKVSKDGTIVAGRLRGKKVGDVKAYYDRKKARSDNNDKRRQQQSNDRAGGRPTLQPHARDSRQVASPSPRPGVTAADQSRKGTSQPVSKGTAHHVPTTSEEANKRLDRYTNFFRSREQHQVAEWMDKLRSHINEVGTDAALVELGEEVQGRGEETQYAGYNIEGNHDADFIEAYLDRNGISLTPYSESGATPTGERRAVSTVTPSSDTEGVHPRGDMRDVFPVLQTLKNKLDETQHLPGLEKSEDLSKLMGGEFGAKVLSFNPDVLKKLDETYGEGQWVVKSYGDEAYAGYGVFFPQRAAQLQLDARNIIWSAGVELSKYGFKLSRDPNTGRVTGLQHENGNVYRFGTPEYEKTIQGDARHWADVVVKSRKVFDPSNNKEVEVGSPAESEYGAAIPEGRFMASPAFAVVGVSNEERAQGVTFKQGGEGRVHIYTRNGKAEIIPHSTWLKKEPLPVVFESDDTRAMAQAAVDAINALPESERKGQLYAPDIVRTADGYKVVEANPANEAGASGYLQDNPLIIDSYVSHITEREPAHVKFIRKLLLKRQRGAAALALDQEGHKHKGKGKDGGQFVSKGEEGGSEEETAKPKGIGTEIAPPEIIKKIRKIARAKINNAPLPSPEDITKARKELELARQGKIRAGGESRGGSAAARRTQRVNLFKEFGGESLGYICCHGCGRKIHHTPPDGSGIERLERGKIFVKCQGGGYQLPNLLPECFACNRSRNDTLIRKEIRC